MDWIWKIKEEKGSFGKRRAFHRDWLLSFEQFSTDELVDSKLGEMILKKGGERVIFRLVELVSVDRGIKEEEGVQWKREVEEGRKGGEGDWKIILVVCYYFVFTRHVGDGKEEE